MQDSDPCWVDSTPTTSLPTSNPPAVSISAPPTAGIDGAINPYFYAWTDEQKNMVTQAWEEADQLAKGHYEWWPGGKGQDAMTLYLGSKSKDDYSWLTGKGHLMENIEREFLVHQGWWTQPRTFTYGYFYCDESKTPGADKDDFEPECGKNTAAYTWDDLGTF
ncbi:hypothetical protein N7478_000086 [Penicillium angulare]|uniref:uncharacterized protein n=1 Tax=Penicillium angulare TaxID=116970 RepID=UPI0025411696|nr:uncharacterized protein N7478_000086 [Penicillium angulare]KAJ5290835.1 hypothetical protein N7478_000086 [Penicillium angulare]